MEHNKIVLNFELVLKICSESDAFNVGGVKAKIGYAEKSGIIGVQSADLLKETYKGYCNEILQESLV